MNGLRNQYFTLDWLATSNQHICVLLISIKIYNFINFLVQVEKLPFSVASPPNAPQPHLPDATAGRCFGEVPLP